MSALLTISNETIEELLIKNKVNRDEVQKQLDAVLVNAAHLPHLAEATEMVEQLEESAQDEAIALDEAAESSKKSKKKESALDFFATNLTNPDVQKNIDPVIGREAEIERVIQIICRRTKNNPLLLGEPGVGKTAIVEGLAKRIMQGDVPELLLNKKIYSLDMGMLIAGTIYRGEFEARLRQVIDEATGNPSIIMFIDELHTIIGTGANQGAMDAANILKPALARGQLRCIGATTPQEYKKNIENDPALERRFQPIFAKEPSLADTIKILEGIKENYEAYHKVAITPGALRAAANLSQRYITNKFLPDKAIDLLDETAAAKRLAAKNSPLESKLAHLEQKLDRTTSAKEKAAQEDNFKKAVALKKEEEDLRAMIKETAAKIKEKKVTMVGEITERDIAEQVAKIIGTPPSELIVDNQKQLNNLENRIKEYIVGQEAVVHEVAENIRRAQLGLSNPERPLASFMFVGESGVGKTELAKTLAKILYANNDALIKLDMSEFNESFGVSKLLGSPAGYIGYKESNQFTDKVKINPYCVILFDEIDKAHRDVIKLLLQILENGEITEASGKKISLHHAIIILTTSYGTENLKRGSIGFGREQVQETKHKLVEKLKEHFSPEVINRLDNICLFESLGSSNLVSIAELELQRFNERLNHYHTKVHSDKKVLEWLVTQLPQHEHGARHVRRFIRHEVEQLMSTIILDRKVKQKYSLIVTDNHLTLK